MTDHDSTSNIPSSDHPSGSSPPRRKRWLLLKITAVLLIGIFLLVLAAPTLLSTGPIVSMVLAQVNKQLNGKVEVSSVSLGWFTGIKVEGVRVFDAANAQIAELDRAGVPLPLWKAIVGKLSLGDVVVDGGSFDAKYDDQGRLNFAMLVKQTATPSTGASSPAALPTESKPSKLPDISGHIKLSNIHGTVSKPGKPTVYLTQLSGDVQIPDINQPITDQLTAGIRVGQQNEGTLTASGTAAVIKENEISLTTAEVHQKLIVTDLDLQAAKPFIPDSVGVDTLDGVLGVNLNLDLTDGKDATVDAAIAGKRGLSIGGKILKGDTFHTDTFMVAVPKLTANFAEGLDHWQSGRIKVGADANSAPIQFKIDQGQVTLVTDVTPAALLNMADGKRPDSAGKIDLAANFDLGKIIPQLKSTVPTPPGVAIQSGTYAQTVKIDITPDKGTVAITTDLTNVTATQTTAGSATKTISLAPIHVMADLADVGGGNVIGGLRDMNLTLQSKFANGEFKGDTVADLSGNLTADLSTMQTELGQFVDLSDIKLAGNIQAKIGNQGQLTTAPYQSQMKGSVVVTGLKYGDKTGPRIDQPLVQVNLTADLHGSATAALNAITHVLLTMKVGDADNYKLNVQAEVPNVAFTPDAITVDQASLNAGFATAVITGVKVSTTAQSPLEKIQSAHWQVDVPDLKTAMATVNSLTVTTATKTDSTKPLEWTGGTIAFSGDVSTESSALKINVSNISGTNIAFRNGDVVYKMKPIQLKMLAAVKLDQLQITQLDGNLGIATLSMPTPIVVSNLLITPQANGSVKLVGNLTDLTQLLAALQGEKPSAYPYRGDYTADENITSQGNTIALKGGVQIAKFQSLNGDVPAFSEDRVAVGNDIALTTAGDDESIAINSLTAAMQSSGALNISLKNGSIQHLQSSRNLQLQPNADYDLAKLWPVIQPMLGDQYKTLKITGHYQKQFNVTGSYPANVPSTDAIKTLNADGDLSVESFDYDGLSLQNFVVPVTLANGKLVTVYAGKPDGQNTAAAATANGGTLDLGNLTIDLTQDPPRLTAPPKKVLMSNVTINPLFADTFLANVINNPVFAGAKDATGLFDLTLDTCTDLPLGDLVTQQVAANTGKLDLRFSMTKLHIGLAYDALQKVMKENSFEANVNDATVSLVKGISTEHIAFVTGQYVIGFDGKVRLSDQAFMPMNVTLPARTIAKKTGLVRDQNQLNGIAEKITFPVEGTVHKPVYRVDKFLGAIAKSAGKGELKGLFDKVIKKNQ